MTSQTTSGQRSQRTSQTTSDQMSLRTSQTTSGQNTTELSTDLLLMRTFIDILLIYRYPTHLPITINYTLVKGLKETSAGTMRRLWGLGLGSDPRYRLW